MGVSWGVCIETPVVMDAEPQRTIAMIDGAWSAYRHLRLPPPHHSRLLTRSAVPLDRLSFFRNHYRIPGEVSIKVGYLNLPNPGHVIVRSRAEYEISINSSYRGWHDAEAAVMAHEMTHVVMKIHGFSTADRFMEEVYTDAFSIFLGSCLLSNFSESVDSYGAQSLSMRLGYLTPAARAYATAIFLTEADMAPPSSPKGPWRHSDLADLRPGMIEVSRRASMSPAQPRLPLQICPRCGEAVQDFGGTLCCQLCLASWKRGFWGWKPAVPPSPAFRHLGLSS